MGSSGKISGFLKTCYDGFKNRKYSFKLLLTEKLDKIEGYDEISNQYAMATNKNTRLVSENEKALGDLCNVVNKNSELKTQIQEGEDLIKHYRGQMEQCEKIGNKNLELEKLVESKNGLLGHQKVTIGEYRREIDELKKVIKDRTELTKSYGLIASLLGSKKRDDKKEQQRVKMFVKLIGKGMSVEEIDKIIEENGYNGLGEKYLGLVRQKRIDRGKNPKFIKFKKK